VVGGGFGGLQAVRKLRRQSVDVTLIDRRNFHLFQPLLYQVATGVLSGAEIAAPLRALFKADSNVRVLLGEVKGFDLDRRHVLVDRLPNGRQAGAIPYDSLIVAAGSSYSYFGHDEWRRLAPDIKSIENAIETRRRILTAFEAAEVESDPGRRAAWLTFVIVGGGPTGVELAGQIGEMAREMLSREFRAVDDREVRILLVEMSERILPAFPPVLSKRAESALEALAVTPVVGRKLVEIDEEAVTIAGADGGGTERVPARTVIWAAGVVASELATALATETNTDVDRAGRVRVGPDLTLSGHPEASAIGDMVQVHDAGGRPVPLPGLAPVAMQQGRYAARAIRDRLQGRVPPPFRYRDKGNLATIGRSKAVADIKGLHLSGLPAWLTWLFVHLFYLIDLQNRLLVFVRWTFAFLARRPGARIITAVDVYSSSHPPAPAERSSARRSQTEKLVN
jgi:NADH dehydrogenase